MKLTKAFIFLIILFNLFLSCTSYKHKLFKGKATLEEARINAIIDFSSKYYKRHSSFLIYNCSDKTQNIFCFVFVINDNKEVIDTLFKIGEYNRYFPNDFLEYNDKLFVWNDENKVYNRKTIEALQRFDKIDSINYKIQIGEISHEQVLSSLVIDHSLKTVYYFICKNDIIKYKSIKSLFILKPDEYPNLECD